MAFRVTRLEAHHDAPVQHADPPAATNFRPVSQFSDVRLAFVVNSCAHYRVKTFEILSQNIQTHFYFFSVGNEWYAETADLRWDARICYTRLSGFNLLGSRIVPSLPFRLLFSDTDVFVKCINGRFALPVTYVISRIKRRPFILFTGIWSSLHSPFHQLFSAAIKYIYRHSDAIVVYGEHVKRYLVALGVHPERIFVECHAVDNEFYSQDVPAAEQTAFLHRWRIPEGQKVVSYVGRLHESKGLNFLIEGFSRSCEVDSVLVIAGEGPMRDKLRALAKTLDIAARVLFLGQLSHEDTRRLYAISDVFVLPSITCPSGKEPWGLVVNEAMNQGVPVIATDAVGAVAGGLVQDGINGLTVEERSSEGITCALNTLLGDAVVRDRMSRNARRIVSEWDNDRMVRGFLDAVSFTLTRR